MTQANPAPGFATHPGYTVVLEPAGKRVTIRFGGETIADSTNAIALYEASYPPRYYIPKADIRMDLLAAVDHQTYCPFKGDARYWTLRAGGEVLENAAWAYDFPFDEAAGLLGHIGFYAEKMSLEIDGETAANDP